MVRVQLETRGNVGGGSSSSGKERVKGREESIKKRETR